MWIELGNHTITTESAHAVARLNALQILMVVKTCEDQIGMQDLGIAAVRLLVS